MLNLLKFNNGIKKLLIYMYTERPFPRDVFVKSHSNKLIDMNIASKTIHCSSCIPTRQSIYNIKLLQYCIILIHWTRLRLEIAKTLIFPQLVHGIIMSIKYYRNLILAKRKIMKLVNFNISASSSQCQSFTFVETSVDYTHVVSYKNISIIYMYVVFLYFKWPIFKCKFKISSVYTCLHWFFMCF